MFCVETFFQKNQIEYILIRPEILSILSLKNQNIDVNDKIKSFLDEKFNHLLNKTFSTKVVFWYAEVITDEILYIFHNYFRNKCCNIENIVLLVSTSGLKSHYADYCKLYKTKGMTIVEMPMVNIIPQYLSNIKTKTIDKNIKRMFSIYGGSYELSPPVRTFLLLFLSQYKIVSSIEIFSLCGKLDDLENWLEKETFFSNREFVDRYVDLYKKYVNEDLILDTSLTFPIGLTKTFNEKFGNGDYQEIMDSHCLMNLIRETTNFQSFSFISEKTFRCFYNHIVPIPVDGKEIIKDLKDYGFWIDEDFFDYSYLQEDFFENKINKLSNSISKVSKLSYDDLRDYYYTNRSYFEQNQEIVVSWPDVIQKKLKEKLINED